MVNLIRLAWETMRYVGLEGNCGPETLTFDSPPFNRHPNPAHSIL
jgi:hypothetical protein